MFDFYDRIGSLVGVWGVNECIQLCFFVCGSGYEGGS